ncbi:MAG: glycosyltransferase [Azospirillaceae bacterium]
MPLSVLYVGSTDPNGTCSHRRAAMERLGLSVTPFDLEAETRGGGRIANVVRRRLQTGPVIERANRAFLDRVTAGRYDLVWCDKALALRPATIRAARETGAVTAQYICDNPFGRMGEPGWRHVVAALPDYDAWFVPRDSSLEDFARRGARRVELMPFAFEPTVNHPPPAGWSDADRTEDVTFIGSPYDNRPAVIRALIEKHGLSVALYGPRWERRLGAGAAAALGVRGPVWGDAYRETMWRSRICLSFVTHSNLDPYAHRSFEIAATRGFLMAERTEGHEALFEEDREAVFFDGAEDLAARIRRWLADPAGREAVAEAGWRRAMTSGYSNDERLAAAIGALFPDLADTLAERARATVAAIAERHRPNGADDRHAEAPPLERRAGAGR